MICLCWWGLCLGDGGKDKEGANPSSSYGTSKFIGVCRNGNRWLARISYGGKKHSLGGKVINK